MILTTCLALLPWVQNADPDWVLLRGPRDLPAQTSYEAIAKAYLRSQSFEILRAKDAETSNAKSRFIFGSITDNPLAGEAFRALGGRVEGELLHFASMSLAPEAGIAIVAPDVDGEGEMILMTGGSADGAFACLTARVDVAKHGWTAIHNRKVRGRGPLPGSPESEARKLVIDGSRPEIVRLDEDAGHLLTQLKGRTDDEAALRVARAFRGSLDVLRALGFRDGLEYGRWWLQEGAELLKQFGENGAKAPELLKAARASMDEALGEKIGIRPVYFLLWGPPQGTNARTFDRDPETGRLRVLLNLAALETPAKFRAAVIHETVHTRQTQFGQDLRSRAALEGVACLLTQQIAEGLTPAEALMWSEAELKSAQRHETAIRRAFERASQSADPAAQASFLQLGATIEDVPGAPSRTGYWLGYLAAQRWHAANREAPLASMLTLGAADLFPSD